jgi:hypothetical protein
MALHAATIDTAALRSHLPVHYSCQEPGVSPAAYLQHISTAARSVFNSAFLKHAQKASLHSTLMTFFQWRNMWDQTGEREWMPNKPPLNFPWVAGNKLMRDLQEVMPDPSMLDDPTHAEEFSTALLQLLPAVKKQINAELVVSLLEKGTKKIKNANGYHAKCARQVESTPMSQI